MLLVRGKNYYYPIAYFLDFPVIVLAVLIVKLNTFQNFFGLNLTQKGFLIIISAKKIEFFNNFCNKSLLVGSTRYINQ